MAEKYLSHLEVKGLHGLYDLNLDFNENISILYGYNGAAKTTVLNIITNALNGDYIRFLDNEDFYFHEIKIVFSNKDTIKITNRENAEEVLVELAGVNEELSIIYSLPYIDREVLSSNSYRTLHSARLIPFFRNSIDSWVHVFEFIKDNQKEIIYSDFIDDIARLTFGQLTPKIQFLSMYEISKKINLEAKEILEQIIANDNEVFGNVFSLFIKNVETDKNTSSSSSIDYRINKFKQVSEQILDYPSSSRSIFVKMIQEVLQNLDLVQENIYNNSSVGLLNNFDLYIRALEDILSFRKKLYRNINNYLKFVNQFLNNKEFRITKFPSGNPESYIELVTQLGSQEVLISNGYKRLSSGERQMFMMLYPMTNLIEENLIMIDEPEISMHIDWQRKIINTISELQPQKQIIIATHSPPIGRDYYDNWIEVKLLPTDISVEEPELEKDNNSKDKVIEPISEQEKNYNQGEDTW